MTALALHIQDDTLSMLHSDLHVTIERDGDEFYWDVYERKDREGWQLADGRAPTALAARRAALTWARAYWDEKRDEEEYARETGADVCHKDHPGFHELREAGRS